MATVHVKALRGFRARISGEMRSIEPGETIEVLDVFARELVSTSKAQIVEPPKPKAAAAKPAQAPAPTPPAA